MNAIYAVQFNKKQYPNKIKQLKYINNSNFNIFDIYENDDYITYIVNHRLPCYNYLKTYNINSKKNIKFVMQTNNI